MEAPSGVQVIPETEVACFDSGRASPPDQFCFLASRYNFPVFEQGGRRLVGQPRYPQDEHEAPV